jgi:hypothetical protein
VIGFAKRSEVARIESQIRMRADRLAVIDDGRGGEHPALLAVFAEREASEMLLASAPPCGIVSAFCARAAGLLCMSLA